MYWIEIVLIAIGLSVDSLIASVTAGAMMKDQYKYIIWKMSLTLAFCQGIMTVLGYFLGVGMSELIQSCDHWIAFILLCYLGTKMIYARLKNKKEEKCTFDPSNMKILFGIGIATSIDAAAVGISLAVLKTPILSAFLIIAITTLLFSILGIFMGSRFGKNFKSGTLEIFGGLVLIAIGIKILVEHLNPF